ncbi:alginate export family protein [Marinilongibacter aquaticus]|uniref:alginate export family protein n=1 Tax=Marinilongibacter aquaticus TaxID=2975157 RepID=UPI0021BDAE93|nr:alginate export family protein [Marinilongibacter aquaticus]UBM57356.1 alginate export family protein [Marinilongibacter aquaticus]
MKKYIYLQFLLLLAGICWGQTAWGQFKLSAEIRPRTEFRNGFKTPRSEGDKPAIFTEQRSRLYFDYAQEKYKIRVALQDIRFWGQTAQVFKQEAGTTFLSEAWGELQLSPNFSVKAGRQIISYDNQRFLGGLEWAQQGRRHDALLLKYKNEEKQTALDLGLAFNADQDVAEPAFIQSPGASYYSVNGNYKSLQYAWFHRDFAKAKLSLLALNSGTQNPDSTLSNKQTLGIVASRNWGRITLATDSYYQTGQANHQKVNAFLLGLSASLQTKWTPITLGYEWVSGKSNTSQSGKTTAFSPDYGTNHMHNGFMDYFYVGPANGNVGVKDLYIKTSFNIGKGKLAAHGHQFSTGSVQQSENKGELKSNMGTEIDLVFSQNFGKDVKLDVGFSQLFASGTLLTLRGKSEKSNNWAWIMLTFKPTLFQTEH